MSLLQIISRVITRTQTLNTSKHTPHQAEQRRNGALGPGKSLFDSKEHYLAFRKAWAAAVTSPRAKKTLVHHKEWNSTELKRGWITSSHVVLYNLLRDKPFYNGFTPLLKTNRLQNGAYMNQHLIESALYKLHFTQQDAEKALKTTPPKDKYEQRSREYGKERALRFLQPFGNTISLELLAAITVPEMPAFYQHTDEIAYWIEQAAKGKKITFRDIIESLDNKQ